MPEIKWIKLSVNIFEDEKIRLIEGMPEGDSILLIWIKLLTLAGKCNSDGLVYLSDNIPYTDEMLATIFRKPVTIIRLALKTFESFKMIGITEQKSIELINWNKHQNIEGMDKIREQNKLRKQKEREKKRLELPEPDIEKQETCHVTSRDMSRDVTQQNKNKNKNINTILRNEEKIFDEVWQLIPNKKGKINSEKKYKALIKKYKPEEILNAVKLFANEMKNKDLKYIPYGSTFFNSYIEDYINQAKDNLEEEIKEIKEPPKMINRHQDLFELAAKKKAGENNGV